MGHGITESDGMFSVREVPWHANLTGDRTKVIQEYPTIAEALKAMRCDWTVQQENAYRRVLLPDPDGGSEPVEMFVPAKDSEDVAWKYNVRSDNGAIVGVVTEAFKPVQAEEAFGFLDALLGGQVQFETAGTHSGGKRMWVLAKIPGHVTIAGDDSARYVYAANAHDGSMAMQAAATLVRIVCRNTFNQALTKSAYGDGAARTYRFRHTGNLQAKFADARKVMNMTVGWSEEMKKLGDSLGLIPVTDRKAKAIIEKFSITQVEDGMGDRAIRNRKEAASKILRIFKGEGEDGDTRGNAPGTAWSLLNAGTEFADWYRRTTVRTDQVMRSFDDRALKDEMLQKVLAGV